MKTALLLFLTFIFSLCGTAQEFKWKETETHGSNVNQLILGKNSQHLFILFSKFAIKKTAHTSFKIDNSNKLFLVTYNLNNYALSTSTPFELKKTPYQFYDGYMDEDGLFFIYSSFENEKYILYVDRYTTEGVFAETKALREYVREYKNDYSDPFTFVVSANRNFLLFINNKEIVLYNKSFKSKWQKARKEVDYMDALLMNDGVFFAVERKDSIFTLLRITEAGDVIRKQLDYSPDYLSQFKFSLNERDQELVIAVVYGINPDDDFISQGIILSYFDPNTITLKKSFKIKFSDGVLRLVTEKMSLANTKGLRYCSLFDLIFPPGGGTIALVQRYYQVSSSSFISGHYEDMVIMKTDKTGESVQKVLKKQTYGDPFYDSMLSAVSFYANDKLYILYNQGAARFKLKTAVYDSNLELLSQTEMLTYKEHKIYLGVRHPFKIAENTYFIAGRQGRNIGGVEISFK